MWNRYLGINLSHISCNQFYSHRRLIVLFEIFVIHSKSSYILDRILEEDLFLFNIVGSFWPSPSASDFVAQKKRQTQNHF